VQVVDHPFLRDDKPAAPPDARRSAGECRLSFLILYVLTSSRRSIGDPFRQNMA